VAGRNGSGRLSRARQTALPTVRTASEGYLAAAGSRVGLRADPALARARIEFTQITSEDGRLAFADKWINLNARALETTWPFVYELLRLVRERKLYEQTTIDRKTTYATFEGYFEATFGQGFEQWIELERTYRFAEQYAPRLFEGDYAAARDRLSAAARGAIADQLRLTPHRSDRLIAEQVGVDRMTVARVRKQLLNDGAITPSFSVEQRDGTLRSVGEKMRATSLRVSELLRAHPERSNAWIASDAGTNQPVVRRIRAQCEAAGTIPLVTQRIGRDGRARELDNGQVSPETVSAKAPKQLRHIRVEPTPEGFACAARTHLGAEGVVRLVELLRDA